MRSTPASGDRALHESAGPRRHAAVHGAPSRRRAARSKTWAERADIFGLGALLYEILSGECPYGRGNVDTILKRAKRRRRGAHRRRGASASRSPRRIRAIAAAARRIPIRNERFQSVSDLKDRARRVSSRAVYTCRRKTLRAGRRSSVTEGRQRRRRVHDRRRKVPRFSERRRPVKRTLSIMEAGARPSARMALVLFEPRAAGERRRDRRRHRARPRPSHAQRGASASPAGPAAPRARPRPSASPTSNASSARAASQRGPH